MVRSVWLAVVAASLGFPAQLEASPNGCMPPKPGRYVVMGQGQEGDTPLAQLIQERWHADGRIEGVRFERRSQVFSRRNYTGKYQIQSGCQVSIKRKFDVTTTSAIGVLNPAGEPVYSLSLRPNVVLSSRWFPQGEGTCTAADLDGVVLSNQQGLSWNGGRWLPNAVVQREVWRNGNVQGVALSNYGGKSEQASYSGRLTVQADCFGLLTETDSKGTQYNYRSVLLTGRRGYVYLQSDPQDLTLGLLEHVSR